MPAGAWALARGDVRPWSDAPVGQLLNAASTPVRLQRDAAACRLPLFGAESLETVECAAGGAAPGGSGGEQQQQAAFAVDTVCFAGGPVWALDWAPLAPADAAAGPLQCVEALALTTHPAGCRRHPIGAAQHGPGALQLWGVPSSDRSTLLPGGLPKLLALLWHDGRLAWDVAWCPGPGSLVETRSNAAGLGGSSGSGSSGGSGASVPLQGLLAAVLGNGDVAVWPVPTIQALLDLAAQQQQGEQQQPALGQEQQPGASALSLRLPCVWQLAAAATGGSLASCCRWLPTPPHDQLLVGCWDGKVAIWQLTVSQQGAASASPVLLLTADATPIRAVAWEPNSRWWHTGADAAGSPASIDEQSPPQQQQQQQQQAQPASQVPRHFLTTSNLGTMKVFDVHDVMQAVQERMVSRHAINAAVWLGPPHVWMTAQADGTIRQFWLDAGVQALDSPQTIADVSGSCGSVWGLSACVPMAVVAYVGDGGLLGVLPLEPPASETRHRKSHAAVSGIASLGDGELWLLRTAELPGNAGLYIAGKENSKVLVAPLPNPDTVLHAVAFSPNFRGLAMLAAGGGAGLVRLHAVSAEVVPAGSGG